jgi:integrase
MAQYRAELRGGKPGRCKARPKLAPRDRYEPDTYAHAITRAARGAGVPHWHPNQLRHAFATLVRAAFDLDTAKSVLGHSSPTTTEVYAERDAVKAAEAAKKLG